MDSEYPHTHHSHLGSTQAIPILITVTLVLLRLSLYSSNSPWRYSDYPFTHQSPWRYSDYPYTHHSLLGVTRAIPILIKVSVLVLGLSLYSSQFPWWYSGYPYTHQSLPGGIQTIFILITVSVVVVRLSLYSSQSPWW